MVIGQSGAMERLFGLARTVAGATSSVLILEESGTGKDVLPLAHHFLAHYGQELKKVVPDFSSEVLGISPVTLWRKMGKERTLTKLG